jgi:hypothetical protein
VAGAGGLFGGSGASNGCWCIASTFARADFKTVARRTPMRPIMRHDLEAIAR